VFIKSINVYFGPPYDVGGVAQIHLKYLGDVVGAPARATARANADKN
jgi:hypothetical protein